MSEQPVLIAATGDSVLRIEADGHAAAALRGSGAQCIAVDPGRADTVYAGCHGEGAWRSTDGGRSFEDMKLPARDVFSVAASAVDGAVYAGCEPSMLFRSDDGGASWRELESLRRIPSAPTWSFPPRPWTSHVRWIAPSPHEPGRVLVGIELGGLMLTDDGGESWLDHRPGAQPDVHSIAWHATQRSRAYEAGGGGAAWSSDGGTTWEPADEGRDRRYVWGLAVDPYDPDRWYVSASHGPRQAHGGGHAQARIYRWDRGGGWQPAMGGLPDPLDSMPYALTAADGAVFAGFADGCLYSSGDGGESWAELPLGGDVPARIIALQPLV